VSGSTVSGGTVPRQPRQPDVAVIGLGYVGLTLAALFASSGLRTLGLEVNKATAAAARARRPPFFEPGLAQALAALPAGRFTVRTTLPRKLPPAVVICVGTPVDRVTREPALDGLDAAVDGIASRINAGTLVVVRSTVPLGTARSHVLPRLAGHVTSPLLAVCPERTIQGRALAELRELPQVIGGLNEESARRADELFARVTSSRTLVSSLEAAEMVKLVNNAHTDIIYGFGNEVAAMAGAVGLDADEIISAANSGYPRPDLSRPGFVGGSCLTKDPYLLMHSLAGAGVTPRLVAAARAVNEAVPGQVVGLLTAALGRAGRPLHEAKVLVCGIAYKGRPETDDVRGAASAEVARMLANRVRMLAGHDFLVPAPRIAELGYVPASLETGMDGADALILLTDHPGYAVLDVATVAGRMCQPAIVLDLWGLVREEFEGSDKVTYLRWGRG
jgi:UDP-N-acetyl-D-mannosaminuronic acid dehydrogenase